MFSSSNAEPFSTSSMSASPMTTARASKARTPSDMDWQEASRREGMARKRSFIG